MREIIFLQANQPDQDSIPQNPISPILSWIIILILFLILQKRLKNRMVQPLCFKKPILRTKLICPSCGHAEITFYREGDEIFKTIEENCQKCGSKMKVGGIFAISPPKKKLSWSQIRMAQKVSYDVDVGRRDVVLYSFMTRSALTPRLRKRDTSQRKEWWLLDGLYFVSHQEISETGGHRCYNAWLAVDQALGPKERKMSEIPDWIKHLACDCLKPANKNSGE